MEQLSPPVPRPDTEITTSLISELNLAAHPEGGYFRRLHATESPSTSSIHYLLTPSSPIGHFHRNRCLTYHFWHRGRGRYILVDSKTGKAETFPVGNGGGEERLMWVVEGGVWKVSFLEEDQGEGLLISEVVVPEWNIEQHEFMSTEALQALVGVEKANNWEAFLGKEA